MATKKELLIKKGVLAKSLKEEDPMKMFEEYDRKFDAWWAECRKIDPSLPATVERAVNGGIDDSIFRSDPFGAYDDGLSPNQYVATLIQIGRFDR